MKRRWMRFSHVTFVSAAVGTMLWVNAGSLTPPVGPVSSTMKTLTEVEPRTVINAVNTPGDAEAIYVLSAPGSYYLAGNLTGVSGKNGIKITADHVTLDLNGFTLDGGGVGSSGVWVSGLHASVCVRNGSLHDWVFMGLDLGSAHNSTVESIRCYQNSFEGIRVWYSSSVRDCVSESNQNRGFDLGGGCVVTHCSAVLNGDDGFVHLDTCSFSNCSAQANSGKGFNGTMFGEGVQPTNNNTYLNCSASYNVADGFHGGNAGTYQDCAAQNNGGVGIVCLTDCTITGCSLANNGLSGLDAADHATIANTSANGNGAFGLYVTSGTISGCTAASNGQDGVNCFFAGLSVLHSTVVENLGNGILLRDGCKVEDCNVSNNGLIGILVDPTTGPISEGCQIRNCQVRRNFNDGIQVTARCLVEGNHCVENGSLGRAGGNGAGIQATGAGNRLDSNNVVRNDRGIQVTSSPSLIIRNSADANTTNYVIAVNNKVGVIAAAPNSMAINGSTGGAGVGSTNPTANLSY